MMTDMPGAMPDSATPKKKRVASRPPTLKQVVVSMRMVPQISLDKYQSVSQSPIEVGTEGQLTARPR